MRDLAALGASYPADEHMFALLRNGIRALVAADEQAQWLEFVDQYEALPDERPRMAERMQFLEAELRRRYPPYAQALADRSFWLAVSPIVAARRFLRGWENVSLPFRRSEEGLVPESLIDALPEDHVRAIGGRAMELMYVDAEAEKNSASPSPSGGGQQISPAAPTPRTAAPDGSSTASSSPAIPASASPTPSGPF